MAAIVKEYKQLHDMTTFGIVCPDDLAPKKSIDILLAINLIKETQSIKIKGRACSDGRVQRAYITN